MPRYERMSCKRWNVKGERRKIELLFCQILFDTNDIHSFIPAYHSKLRWQKSVLCALNCHFCCTWYCYGRNVNLFQSMILNEFSIFIKVLFYWTLKTIRCAMRVEILSCFHNITLHICLKTFWTVIEKCFQTRKLYNNK